MAEVQNHWDLKLCGHVAPGSSEEDIDASVAEIRCQLPERHLGDHAAIVTWERNGIVQPARGGRLERVIRGDQDD